MNIYDANCLTPSLILEVTSPGYIHGRGTSKLAVYLLINRFMYFMEHKFFPSSSKIITVKFAKTFLCLGNWPTTLALWCVEGLTFSSCLGGEKADEGCGTKDEQEACLGGGGSCSNYLDGYYAETGICILLGT